MDVDTMVLAFRCSRTRAQAAHAGMNSAMALAGCTTVRRAAMWCAQIGHETLSLYYDQEIWGPTAAQRRYEGRADLGNTVAGDGYRFRGRGRIQLTGRVNYVAFSRWCHSRGLVPAVDHLVRNPDLVAAAPWRELAAAWYWTVARSTINSLCDKGDVRGVTRLINGGTNGLADREDRYDGAIRLGDRLLPNAAAPGRDWFDMATEEDLRRIVREEVPQATWHHPIPDWYTADGDDAMPAFAALGWSATHGAHARDAARQGATVATRAEAGGLAIRKDLAEIGKQVTDLARRATPATGDTTPGAGLNVTEILGRLADLDTRLRALEHKEFTP